MYIKCEFFYTRLLYIMRRCGKMVSVDLDANLVFYAITAVWLGCSHEIKMKKVKEKNQ